jgi:hypothetical protein
MVIDLTRRYLFVHVLKCAGESITQLLLDPRNGGRQFLNKHSAYKTARSALGSAAEDLLAFAVVRNPFAQVLSFYEHLRKPLFLSREAIEAQYPGSNGFLAPYWASELAMRLDFPAYAQSVYGRTPPPKGTLSDCCHWLESGTSHAGVRRVLRFERLQVEFAALADELSLSDSLPHLNACHGQADPSKYRDRYDDVSRRVVGVHFARTLREFGYEF